jgi:uncharacterized protein (DUF924 family)
MNKRAKAILYFWFEQVSHKEKFEKNKVFDEKVRIIFFKDYQKAVINKYDHWEHSANECLALIILLDQFSRNFFRNNTKAFAMDKKARSFATKAIDLCYHKILKKDQIIFLFLPFMHSEELKDQIYCKKLINTYLIDHPNYDEAKKYAQIHEDIIKKFGRFPYRNKVLGRKTTKEEEKYLNSTHYDFFNI